MKNQCFALVLLLSCVGALRAAPLGPAGFATVEGQTLTLDNGRVHRVVQVSSAGAIATVELRESGQTENLLTTDAPAPGLGAGNSTAKRGVNSAEFAFVANHAAYSGRSAWTWIGVDKSVRLGDGGGATLRLRAQDGPAAGLGVEITYLLYPDSPVVRKRLRFRNDSTAVVELESVDVEVLNPIWHAIETSVLASYGRYRHVGPFVGTSDDSVVVAHNEQGAVGLLLGNEAPGVMKRVTAFADGKSVTTGLTHARDDFAFRKWLQPGETWASPWTFVAAYRGHDPAAALAQIVPDYVRRHLGLRLAASPSRPTFVYNTWEPFRSKIDAALIEELADAAAASGVKEFVIDDGWQEKSGDWQIDRVKFPNGLKPVFDHIKAKGMKPGLWISLAAVARDSDVFRSHPEWMVQDEQGRPVDLHEGGGRFVTACLTTDWKDHMREVVLRLVKEHGLGYVKLDLAIVTSAYVFDRSAAGCRATGHRHRDREESLLMIYQRAWELFDELHAAAPDLFIDCTFETMGAAQLVDLDMAKHAEGNWLSNFNNTPPDGSRRVRQMGWWRSGTIPAGVLVIGNQKMDVSAALLSFQSLTGTLPIMLGDPRKLGPEQREVFCRWSTWFQHAEDEHQVMLYRQDLAGFGEPSETAWDGFQRINTDTQSGGIVAVFRNAAAESERTVVVPGLTDERRYEITRAPLGEPVATLTGRALAHDGFRVRLSAASEAAVFEIRSRAPSSSSAESK